MSYLSAKQLAEWEVYEQIDPTGEWKEDLRYATLMSQITNLFIGAYGKKGTKLTEPLDFLPFWYKEGELNTYKGQSVEAMKQMLMGIAKKQNVAVQKRTKKGKK